MGSKIPLLASHTISLPVLEPTSHSFSCVHCRDQAVVTLWGQLANNFDAEGLQEASSEEPIIVLFIGMTVSQFSGIHTHNTIDLLSQATGTLPIHHTFLL